MGHEVYRVPMDFKWPLNKVWDGFCVPDGAFDEEGEYTGTWERTPPPTGDGWQMWETVSEGSPISPVFATPEELASWLATHESMDGSYSQWLAMIYQGWAPSFVVDFNPGGKGIQTGVQASEE